MPSSLPALAAALAEPERAWPCLSATQALLAQPLVPAYRVPVRGRREMCISRLADAVALLAERLDRLPAAYSHWQTGASGFEAGAYFDLHPLQVEAMVRTETLGATLDVTLHADLLSPAFRSAERFWAEHFCPAYHASSPGGDDAYSENFRKHILPAMQRRLEMASSEIATAGALLFERGDVTFLLAAAAPDERQRHLDHLPPGDEDWAPLFLQLPSLTLSRSFDRLVQARAASGPGLAMGRQFNRS